ncbi:MAG: HlyD family efflux transporter periplasmic adaptor subunit, partial [Planctomycetaceae bacterium]
PRAAGRTGGRGRGKGRDKDTESLLKILDSEPTSGPAPAPVWVVTARNIQIGQIVSSGITNTGGGTTVMTVSDLSQIFVLAAVDESDIGKVKVGQKVITTVDAFPGKVFPGRVVRIATKGVNSSNVVTFEVKILVISPEQDLLKPEMTANVEIVCASKDSVVMVPSEAVVRKGGKSQVTVIDASGATTDRPVEVGINDGTNVEITDGLSEGETVIVRKDNGDSKWKGGQDRPMSPGRMMGGPR